jgi:gamma-glutamyltranspeptidase
MQSGSTSAQHAIITTPQADATEAGFEILKEGGTAIDALIAAGAMLCVTSPHMVGIGGDALWMLDDHSLPSTIVGIGQAGQSLPPSGRIHKRGEESIATTAAAMASWHTAYQISKNRWHSKIPWSRLLAPAIEKARVGFTVTDSQLFWQAQRRELIAASSDLLALTSNNDGSPLSLGDTLRLPALADSLESLSRHGAQSFYTGELGEALSAGFAKRNVCLTAKDLSLTIAPERPPISIAYRQGRLFNVEPPCQGITTLQAMTMLNQFAIEPLNNTPAYYHLMVEAIKNALKYRNRSLCDPVFSPLDSRAWLEHAQQQAKAINPAQAAPWTDEANPADTAWIAAIDSEGRGASLIQSLYFDWGSACTIGDTGILWHNRAAGFSSDPNHPNAWAPGKRPAHTLNPSLYIAENGDRTLFGSQGGDGQPQTQTVLATQLIDFGQSLNDALHAPRFLLGRSFFDSSDNLKVEANLDAAIVKELSRLGHDIEVIPALSPLAGLAGVARIYQDGSKEAMHDPRGKSLTKGF